MDPLPDDADIILSGKMVVLPWELAQTLFQCYYGGGPRYRDRFEDPEPSSDPEDEDFEDTGLPPLDLKIRGGGLAADVSYGDDE